MTSKVSSNTEKVLRHKSLGVPPLNCAAIIKDTKYWKETGVHRKKKKRERELK